MRVLLLQEDDGFDQMVMAETNIAAAIDKALANDPDVKLTSISIVQDYDQLLEEAANYRAYLTETP